MQSAATGHNYRYVFARSQTLEDNGELGDANKQQPKKSNALSSAFERAAAYKKSQGKVIPPAGPVESKPPSTTDFKANVTDLKLQEEPRKITTLSIDQPNFPASPAEGKPSSPSSTDVAVNVEPQEAVNLQDVSPVFNSLKSKQESEMAAALAAKAEAREAESAQEDTSQGLEVEIITRDGIIRRKVTQSDKAVSKTKIPKRTSVSSSDFVGLGFSDKKSSSKGSLPAGLAVGLEAPPPSSLPEVEIITRDGKAQQESKDGLYKPKVVTWGIFERPANISEAYGGGRTIKPGEQLETEEEKKARDARTKEVLAAYYKKIGLDVDPQIKADCAKALQQGNQLFERGYVQRALEQFEKVMQQMPYQSELHGLAALQWAVSLDASNRFQEARAMYEKIVSHPNVTVRKKAKQLLYGFQAMDNLKVATTSKWDSSVYRKYFDAFSDGYNTLYKPSEEDTNDGSMRSQDFVYLGLLLFPLAVFLLIVALKGR